MCEYRFILIPMEQISDDDDTFRISFDPSDEFLYASLAAKGMLQPLLVQKRTEKHYRLITGFKRRQVARRLLWPQVPVLVVPDMPGDLPLFEMALHDRLAFAKPLNPFEIAVVLHKLQSIFLVSEDKIVDTYLPLLGLGKNRKLLNLYLPLYGLDDRCRAELIQDWLSLDFSSALVALTVLERHLLLDLFKALRLGKNKQKEFFLLIKDVCRIQVIDTQSLLQQSTFQTILNEPVLSPTQKAERFKAELMRLRYPRFSAAQQAFNNLMKTAHPAASLRLQPAPFFSSEEYSVSFSFKTAQEFQQQVQELQRLDGAGVIEKMVHLV